MENSKIEWCDHTFSPWEGCEKVSPGCKHCYAEARDKLYHRGEHWGPNAARLIHTPNYFDQPRKWNDQAKKAGRIARVFCGSLCDILEDGSYLERPRQETFAMVRSTPHLMWLFLTKRPENWDKFPASWLKEWPPNAMFGFTAENDAMLVQRAADFRELRSVTHGLRAFISAEPLLSALPSLSKVLNHIGIDWVIGGGESGDQARPSHPAWYRSIENICTSHGVPFLFKQWGEWVPTSHDVISKGIEHRIFPDGTLMDWGNFQLGPWDEDEAEEIVRVGKKAAGRFLDGVEYNGLPYYWPQNVGIPEKPKKKNPLEVIA